MELELKDTKEELMFIPEYALTKKPLQMDLLVVRNEMSSVISNPIGEIFRKYNIMEYKSPVDHLNIDTFYKVNAYACLYKDSARNVNGYHASDITITLVRKNSPQKMFRILMEDGYTIIKRYPGIYYVTGALFFATQILVTSEFDQADHHWLAYLDNNIERNSYERLLEEVNVYTNKRDYENMEAVLQVVSDANKKAIQKWKEETKMCEALREIMADELAEGRAEGRAEGMDILVELVHKLREGITSEELLDSGYTDMEINKALLLV